MQVEDPEQMVQSESKASGGYRERLEQLDGLAKPERRVEPVSLARWVLKVFRVQLGHVV